MKQYRQFIFESYDFNAAAKRLDLNYSFDGELKFTERLAFNFDFVPEIDPQLLDNALFGLFLIAGTSYYKAYLAPEMVVRPRELTPSQAVFFNKLYRQGYGEYFAVNQLSPDRLALFEGSESSKSIAVEAPDLDGLIVPLGGGKDSLTTVGILRDHRHSFVTWTVNHLGQVQPQLDKIGSTHLHIERTIAPELIQANHEGAYNGHIPLSAYLAFSSVLTAILTGKRDIAVSNESSAGEANLDYQGIAANHQYSKTLEFERDFQQYVIENISPSVRYFSFMRPFSELRIAEIFCARWLNEYDGLFSSCNRNFKLGHGSQMSWCGECAKCAFVFLIFAPFLSRKRLIELFGKNLFADPKLERTYEELLGIQGHKPFDCVGEIKECREAVVLARQKGEWPELDQYKFPELELDWRAMGESSMPNEYLALLSDFSHKP